MVNEGYAKVKTPVYGILERKRRLTTRQYKDSLYYLWTTNMDRLMIPPKYMDEFNKVPRSHLKLTATVRYFGKYTGMDIADEGMLGFDVCAGPLSQNIGRLAQPVYDEILYALRGKIDEAKEVNGKWYYCIIAISKSGG